MLRILYLLPFLLFACQPKQIAGDNNPKMTQLQIPSAWDLVSCEIDGKTIAAVNDKAFVAIRAGEIGGHTGCNSFGGEWSGDPGKMKVPGVMSTKMYCSDCAVQERTILDLMNGTISAETSDGKTLILAGKAGKLKLRRNDGRLK